MNGERRSRPKKAGHPERSAEAWAESKDLQYPRAAVVRSILTLRTNSHPARLEVLRSTSLRMTGFFGSLRAIFIAALPLTFISTHAADSTTPEAMRLLKSNCFSCHNDQKKKGGLSSHDKPP